MLMEVASTQDQPEKEFIFSTQLDHGSSYNLVNYKHWSLVRKLTKCYPNIENAIDRSNCADIFNANDTVKRIAKGSSDLWIMFDKDREIIACVVIGFAHHDQSSGIIAEAMGGESFLCDYDVGMKMMEDYYRELGYDFFEITGRKGWEKLMAPRGYEFKSIKLRKAL